MLDLKLFPKEESLNKTPIIYDVYHDECKEDGCWHCFLFIPIDKKVSLNNLICQARENLHYSSRIHYSSISKRAKSNHKKVLFVKSLNTISTFSIQQQKYDGDIYLGENKFLKAKSESQINAKLAIFRDKGNHKDMYENMKAPKKFETTFRMGLKGANHFLFEEEVIIRNIFHDYSSSVSFDKEYNEDNILKRLINESRDNIKFDESVKINTIAKDQLTADMEDHNILQLVDVIVGSIRTRLLNQTDFPARFEAAYPYTDLLEKEIENSARMENSRFYKAYKLTNAKIIDDEWTFENMKIEKQNEDQFKLID
jgi:hypothetical protein